MRSAVSFANVTRVIDKVRLADDVSLEISDGEFFVMLGPVGSGKTMCMRLIAGFDEPTSGEIRIFGEDMFAMPPYRRAVNTVFRDCALFPHLNVAENVAYGLKVAGESKARRMRLVDEMLELVDLSGLGKSRPDDLTEVQRRHVALARALIMKPRVLLLDEPFGMLDLELRAEMQEELKALQSQLGTTFVLVTQDQGEALSIADRVAVFEKCRVVQVGTPHQIYYEPATPFVAEFVGASNVLPPDITHLLTGRRLYSSLRPEAIRVMTRGGKPAKVLATSFFGANTRVQIDMAGTPVTVLLTRNVKVPEVGQTIRVGWNDTDLHLMEET